MSDLMRCAITSARNAYCPHSKFHVGCAVRWSNGYEDVGCNVENASFGLTICAERNAIFASIPIIGGTHKIVEVAIACPDLPDGFEPSYSMPCGACRQVLAEFAAPECIVRIDRVGQFAVEELLPKAFKL